MPNSLRSRLKNLVHKGVLSEKDLERIVIMPADKDEKALKAAKVIKEYCQSISCDCNGCMFSAIRDKNPTWWLTCCCVLCATLPEGWEIEKEGEQDG